MNPTSPSRPRSGFPWMIVGVVATTVVMGSVILTTGGDAGRVSAQEKKAPVPAKEAPPVAKEAPPAAPAAPPKETERPKAPELDGGIAWLNTGKPVKLADLKGKIVLLDFWTLCCINCIHTLPDLAKLEKKYEKELVVIGVHSAKFDNEKNSESIRKAILRYEIRHPVVNDAEMKIWKAFDVSSWPTLILLDTDGRFVAQGSGEGLYEAVDKKIAELIVDARLKKTLNETPVRFDTSKFREKADTALYFPGKVYADEKGGRLVIADSTHHRVVVTDLAGKSIATIGTGLPGKVDGAFDKAQFDDPQGIAVAGDLIYVADRRNHVIRTIDLKSKIVATVAGTGEQDREGRTEGGGAALKLGMNSPWDLWLIGNTMYIAMAGHHQIWTMDLKTNVLAPFAGDGRENIKDGPLFAARFAQPSGLAADDKFLYVADPEVSAVRKLPLDGRGRVETLVGTGLFDFGDKDGTGLEALIQHALAVGYFDGKVYVADTYNSKIKTIDLKTLEVKTWLEGKKDAPILSEPAGMSIAGGKIYVADTNNHRIRVIDLKTKAISTLELTGVPMVGAK